MSLAAGAVAGAIGGGLAVTVLAPLTAANNFIGSFFFGNGMIVGERKAYQHDWPKIKKRLDAGESFITILEEYTIDNTTAVMSTATHIIQVVKPVWFQMVKDYLLSIPQDLIKDISSLFPQPTGPVKQAADATISTITGGIIQEAFAEEDSSQTKFVTDYIQEAKNLPFKLLEDIVEKMLSGKLSENVEKKIAYVQVYKEIISKKKIPDTAEEAIKKATTSGSQAAQIATLYNKMVGLIAGYAKAVFQLKKNPANSNAQQNKKLFFKAFLIAGKKYNSYVQSIGKANLSIDTAKSLTAGKLIPKS